MLQRPATTAGFATWTRRVDEQDLVAVDLDLLRLESTGVSQSLDHHVHELDLVVLVEQVGHAIGGQSYATRQHAILGVGHEVDHRVAQTSGVQRNDGIGWIRSRSLEGEEQSSAGVVDHVAHGGSVEPRSESPGGPARQAGVVMSHRCARASPARA